MMNGSGAADKQALEMANRKRIIEELAKLGADTSGFTDAIIADGQAFWKLAETFKYLKEQSNSGKTQKNPPQMNDENKMMGSGMTNDENMEKSKDVPSKTPVRPALTEKVRKALQDKLDKIPTEKRDTVLPKMLKTAQAQYDTAKSK